MRLTHNSSRKIMDLEHLLRRGWGAGAAAGRVGPTACAGRAAEAVPLPPCQAVREAAPTRWGQGRRAAAVPPGRRLPNSAAPPRCSRRRRHLHAGRWGTAPPPAGSAGTAAGGGASTGWAGQDYHHRRRRDSFPPDRNGLTPFCRIAYSRHPERREM